MCGRLTIATPAEALKKRFGVRFSGELKPNYNAAPTQNLPVILNSRPDRISRCRWGLIPSWARDEKIGNRLINARAETLLEKPSFRQPFRTRRCLVLADGFYEWRQTESGKVPYRIALDDGGPFAMAGIWDVWKGPDGNEVSSFSIITTEPNPLMKPIHHRMPVILTRDREATWLEPPDLSEAQGLLKPFPLGNLRAYPVSTRINNPGNNSEDLIRPVGSGL